MSSRIYNSSCFKVSVIIPVYNAELYVQKAAESALCLDEVGEVILIEDRSPDNALKICKGLEKQFDKVKLYTHPNNENRGAGASRNLGIKKANCEYIAFLDADDYYLPNRFTIDTIKFRDKSIDGVYSAALNIHIDKPEFKHLHTIRRPIKPESLVHYLIRGTYGHFCTNGITLRKSLLDKTGGFNEELRLHQDTELWLRCAYYGTLVAGSIDEPTSIILSHGENRISGGTKSTRLQYLVTLFEEFSLQDLGFINYSLLLKKALKNTSERSDFHRLLKRIRF